MVKKGNRERDKDEKKQDYERDGCSLCKGTSHEKGREKEFAKRCISSVCDASMLQILKSVCFMMQMLLKFSDCDILNADVFTV